MRVFSPVFEKRRVTFFAQLISQLSIIEAFSMKTPVIVNNLGALPEVVEDSGGGFIYNNEGELIDALETLSN